MQNSVIVSKNKLYRFKEQGIEVIEPKSAAKYRVGARLPLQDITALSFKLPLNLSAEQLAVQVELKMYQEGGLDPNRDYAIDFVSYKIEAENITLVEAFAAAKEDIEHRFGEIAKRVGFIDILYPKFIAYEALYDRELRLKENHLFFYLSEEEAFAVIYQDGRYIGYRAIDSLANISKKLGIEVAKLKSLLIQKGVVMANYTPEEMHIFDGLQETLFKNIEKVVYAINFKRSFFGLEHIDRLIVDFEGELIPGLRDMFVAFGIDGEWIEQPLGCCDFKAQEASLATEALYVANFDELEQRLNFTFFERKKPLWHYRVLWVGVAAFLTLIALGAFWSYLRMQKGALEEEITRKEAQLQRLKRSNAKLFRHLKKLKEQKRLLLEDIQKRRDHIAIYQDTLDAIPFVEKSKMAREKMINDIVEGLYRFRLSARSIEQNGTKVAYVEILSQNDEREKIARFISFLLDKNYSDVQTQRIEKEDGLYHSRVKVAR